MNQTYEDPTFKALFGISTLIAYEYDVIVDPKHEVQFTSLWHRFWIKRKKTPLSWRVLRFNRFLKRIRNLKSDYPYCNRVEIRFINKQIGYGVFAKTYIPPYSILNHYAGVLKPDKLISLYNDSAFQFSDFTSFSIDGKKRGNWTRFMNHGREGDKKTNVIAWEHFYEQGPRIIFTSSHRGIAKGQQLLYSYGDSYWEGDRFSAL